MAVLTHEGLPAGRFGAAAALAVAAFLGLFSSTARAQASGPALEYAVKANYLYKFGPFVSWPDGAFASGASPFNICVLGQDPFGRVLDDAVAGQAVGGHPIAVRRPAAGAYAAAGCHVVYVGRPHGKSVPDVLRTLRSVPVLTVTDQRNGGGSGIIHFVLRDGRVRFALDARAAQANGMTLSSKLQALATPLRAGEGE
jgi:hypothetical protein